MAAVLTMGDAGNLDYFTFLRNGHSKHADRLKWITKPDLSHAWDIRKHHFESSCGACVWCIIWTEQPIFQSTEFLVVPQGVPGLEMNGPSIWMMLDMRSVAWKGVNEEEDGTMDGSDLRYPALVSKDLEIED